MTKQKGRNVLISAKEMDSVMKVGNKHPRLEHLSFSKRIHQAVTESLGRWREEINRIKGALCNLVRVFLNKNTVRLMTS